MAKILFRRHKKEYVKELDREITIAKERFFYVQDINKDFITENGTVKAKDLKKKDGSIVKTNKGKEFVLFTAQFKDEYSRIKRTAQIITPKDIGIIITETGLNKDSKVIDAGTGSGALACYLAKICKEVTSYDIKDTSIETGEKNKEFLDIKNLTIKKKDVFTKIDEKDVDTIILDMPEPHGAIKSCKKALKIGGFLVSYVPNITQVSKFIEEIKKDDSFVYLKTVELIPRKWKIDNRIARPNSQAIGHTAFLSFVRKIKS
tara:strand:+ start:1116 stop:1898 length:783 start_codon:yes stop_codon:yes gene_type:complete